LSLIDVKLNRIAQNQHERLFMKRLLLIDIGAGTMDVLYFNLETGLHYKAAVKSPVVYLAEEVSRLSGKLIVTGCEMGGGPVSRALIRHASSSEVYMTASSAATIHHDLARVRSSGIQIVDDKQAEALINDSGYTHFKTHDVELQRIRHIVEGFGVPFKFDIIGICAQDHGLAPAGTSHLDYRHHLFKKRLDMTPFAHALLYKDNEIPSTFNRLNAIAQTARSLDPNEVYVMDSGMAAILGASMDLQARACNNIIVLDVATSHTLAAVMAHNKVAGFLEYHTHDITQAKLENLVKALADGTIDHRQVLKEGGHGAYVRKAVGFHNIEAIIATGPKRRLLKNSCLEIRFGGPLGDHMMTGAVGLLEAIRKYKHLEPIDYI
jgi:uncharacterized protein (DUF1786 family)